MTDDPVLSHLRFDQEPEPQPQEEVAAPAVEAETPAEPVVEAQPRNDDGTFAAKELLAGKYKSVDDLVQAYQNAERRLGELGNEVGQLRQQTQPQYDFTGFDAEEAVTNPQLMAHAATTAWNQGDSLTYERIISAWGETDPFGAARLDARLAAQATTNSAFAQVQPTLQQAQQYAARDTQSDALASVAGKYQDFAAVVGGIDFDTIPAQAEQNPLVDIALRSAVQNGDKRSYEALFETLYLVNSQQQAARHNAATAAATQAADEEAAAEKQQAVVAAASPAPVTGDTGNVDPELQKFYEFMAAPSPTNWRDTR